MPLDSGIGVGGYQHAARWPGRSQSGRWWGTIETGAGVASA